jgi:FMN reductase
MAELVAVLGSVTRPGRLHSAVDGMLARARASPGVATRLLDLSEHRISFADGRAPTDYGDDTAALVDAVTDADAVAFATPIYRGTFTGALKNALDQLPVVALQGKPVGIVSMGATDYHYLGAEWHLRDVFTWFGALVAPVAVYLTPRDFESGRPTAAAEGELDQLAASLVTLADKLGAESTTLGPPPLAARHSG